jgi:hypothetical protein
LPSPLVAAEVDLRDFKTMPLDVQTLRDSRFAAEVSPLAFRAGVLLWCAAWHQVPSGSLPDNDAELAKLAGYGFMVKEWRKVKTEAMTKFVLCSDGRWYHEEVAERAATAWRSRLEHFYERARERLRKANKARTDKGLQPLPDLAFDQWNERRLSGNVPMEKAEAFHVFPAEVPPPPPPEASGFPAENALKGEGEIRERERRGRDKGEGKLLVVGAETADDAAPGPAAPAAPAAPTPPEPDAEPTADRGTRLSADWVLPKAWGEWALGEFKVWTAEKVRTEAAKFRDHWTAKTGKDATKRDWQATWRNWCRSDIAHRDDPKPGQQQSAAAARNAEAKRLLGITTTPSPQGDFIDG